MDDFVLSQADPSDQQTADTNQKISSCKPQPARFKSRPDKDVLPLSRVWLQRPRRITPRRPSSIFEAINWLAETALTDIADTRPGGACSVAT